MLNEAQIGEMWVLFQDYIDVKQRDIVAERYVELLADYGVRDRIFQNATGIDAVLDQAIAYYLDDSEDEDNDYNELEF
jgi:hypothetical protein